MVTIDKSREAELPQYSGQSQIKAGHAKQSTTLLQATPGIQTRIHDNEGDSNQVSGSCAAELGTAQTRWQNKPETDSCYSLHSMDVILPKDAMTTTRRAWRQAGARASRSGRSCPPSPRASVFGGTGAGPARTCAGSAAGIARSMGGAGGYHLTTFDQWSNG